MALRGKRRCVAKAKGCALAQRAIALLLAGGA